MQTELGNIFSSLEDGDNLTLTLKRRLLNWKEIVNYSVVVIPLIGELGALTNFLSLFCRLYVLGYYLGKNHIATHCSIHRFCTKAWGAGSPELGDLAAAAINSDKIASSGDLYKKKVEYSLLLLLKMILRSNRGPRQLKRTGVSSYRFQMSLRFDPPY